MSLSIDVQVSFRREQDRIIKILVFNPFDHADHQMGPRAAREPRQPFAGGTRNGFSQAGDTVGHERAGGGAFGEQNELRATLSRRGVAR
jgi:hypothetical protein